MAQNSIKSLPIWTPLDAPEGYEFEMDISRPAGALRYRILPSGDWQIGPLPLAEIAPDEGMPLGFERKQRN